MRRRAVQDGRRLQPYYPAPHPQQEQPPAIGYDRSPTNNRVRDIYDEARAREMRRRQEEVLSRHGRRNTPFDDEIQRESDLERSMRAGDIVDRAANRKNRNRDRTLSQVGVHLFLS